MSGLPPELRDLTRIRHAIKELRNAGLVQLRKKGAVISLNPHALKEIRAIVGLERFEER